MGALVGEYPVSSNLGMRYNLVLAEPARGSTVSAAVLYDGVAVWDFFVRGGRYFF